MDELGTQEDRDFFDLLVRLAMDADIAELARLNHKTPADYLDATYHSGMRTPAYRRACAVVRVVLDTLAARAALERDRTLIAGARALADTAMKERTPMTEQTQTTTETVLIAEGPGMVTQATVIDGRGRSTTDQIALYDRTPDGAMTLLQSFMLPATKGCTTRLSRPYEHQLVAVGNLHNLGIRGQRTVTFGTEHKVESWAWEQRIALNTGVDAADAMPPIDPARL